MPVGDAARALKNPLLLSSDPELNHYMGEMARNRLQPTVCVSYDRIPVEDIFDGNTRVTLDYNIRCGHPEKFFAYKGSRSAFTITCGVRK